MAATKDAGLPPLPKSDVIRFLPSTTAAAAAEEAAAATAARAQQEKDKGRRLDGDDDRMEEDGEGEEGEEEEGSSRGAGQLPSANEVRGCGCGNGCITMPCQHERGDVCIYIHTYPTLMVLTNSTHAIHRTPQQQLEEAVLQTLVDLLTRDVCHQVCAAPITNSPIHTSACTPHWIRSTPHGHVATT